MLIRPLPPCVRKRNFLSVLPTVEKLPRNLFDIAARSDGIAPEGPRDPQQQPGGRLVPSLFGDAFTYKAAGEVFERNLSLMKTIGPVYPTPPMPTKPGQFLGNDAPERSFIMDSDVDWIAIWNAKMKQARPVDLEALEEQIHATLSLGEELIRTLNGEALTKARALIEADLGNASTSFEGLFHSLFYSFGNRGQAVTTIGEAEYLRRCSPVKSIGVMDLFAWQIPHLVPGFAGQSKALGGHYWTLLSLQWLVRYDTKGERNECPPKGRDPWIPMQQHARLLRQ